MLSLVIAEGRLASLGGYARWRRKTKESICLRKPLHGFRTHFESSGETQAEARWSIGKQRLIECAGIALGLQRALGGAGRRGAALTQLAEEVAERKEGTHFRAVNDIFGRESGIGRSGVMRARIFKGDE